MSELHKDDVVRVGGKNASLGEAAVLDACRRCLASLFTDRAIIYRDTHGFEHMHVALSIGVQRMVRSDIVGTGDATRLLKDDQQITVSCAEGDIGHVYAAF